MDVGAHVDDCQLVTDARTRQLHSADTRMLTVPQHPAVSRTGPLQLLPQEFGTVCRQTYEKQSDHTPGSRGR